MIIRRRLSNVNILTNYSREAARKHAERKVTPDIKENAVIDTVIADNAIPITDDIKQVLSPFMSKMLAVNLASNEIAVESGLELDSYPSELNEGVLTMLLYSSIQEVADKLNINPTISSAYIEKLMKGEGNV
jgi:hypothetical protein